MSSDVLTAAAVDLDSAPAELVAEAWGAIDAALTITAGANEIQRTILARGHLGFPSGS